MMLLNVSNKDYPRISPAKVNLILLRVRAEKVFDFPLFPHLFGGMKVEGNEKNEMITFVTLELLLHTPRRCPEPVP